MTADTFAQRGAPGPDARGPGRASLLSPMSALGVESVMSGRSRSWTRSYGGRRYGETPGRGILRVPIEWTQIRRRGDAEPRSRSYPAWFVQSTATSHRLFAARPGSGALVDVVIAAAAFGGSVVLLSHGAGGASRPDTELNLLSVLLAAGASLPSSLLAPRPVLRLRPGGSGERAGGRAWLLA